MPIEKHHAEALATLAVAIRPHGARQWDVPGVLAILAKVRHLSLAEVAMATIRAAADRTIDTPGCIANTTSSAWRERVSEPTTPAPPKRHQACLSCGQWLERCQCGEKRTRPVRKADPAAGAAKARAALRRADDEGEEVA